MKKLGFLVLVACSGNNNMVDNTPFMTFQDCYDDHHTQEMFTTQKAIEICCIDHPIGTAKMNTVCGTTSASCQSYLGSNLTDSADTMLGSDITTACDHYTVDGAHGGSGSGGMCSG